MNVYWSKLIVAFGLGSLNKMAGWYVQCRYGARVITADGTNNAVFVKSLADVLGVLDALLNAAAAGELDTAIIQVAERKPAVKPGAAKAAAHA